MRLKYKEFYDEKDKIESFEVSIWAGPDHKIARWIYRDKDKADKLMKILEKANKECWSDAVYLY